MTNQTTLRDLSKKLIIPRGSRKISILLTLLGENIDKDNNTFYYIMPYVKMNLDDYNSRNNGLLSSDEQLYLVEQVFRCY